MRDRDDYRSEEEEREAYEYERHMEKEAEYKAYEEEEMQKWLESEGYMDKPTIKEQLQQYGKLTKELKQLEERIQTLRSSMYSLKSPVFDDVPCGGGNSDKIGNVICKMESLEERYLDLISAIMEHQKGIEEMLTLLNPTERLLMRAKYIDGNIWSDVCDIIGYSWRQTHRLHAYCLTKLAQIDL